MVDEFRKQFATNLNIICDRLGLPISGAGRATALAGLFGMSVPSTHKWLSGGTIPDMGKIPLICSTLKCTSDELILGLIDVAPSGKNFERVPIEQKNAENAYNLIADTGFLSQFGKGPFRMMEISSNDMEPYVMEGDYVFYDTNLTPPQQSGVYVIEHGGRNFIRRAQLSLNGHISLYCDNAQFLKEEIVTPGKPSHNDLLFLGMVIARVLVRR